MKSGQSCIVNGVFLSYYRVQFIILNLPKLCVKHQVAHCVIVISGVVLKHISWPLVKWSVYISLVSLTFMGINHPIQERKDCILKWNPTLCMWVDVEWHVLVPPDAHELIIQVENRRKQWSLREVSVACFPIYHIVFY